MHIVTMSVAATSDNGMQPQVNRHQIDNLPPNAKLSTDTCTEFQPLVMVLTYYNH